MSKNVETLKSGSEVTQGHWKWCRSVARIWFPISPDSILYHRKIQWWYKILSGRFWLFICCWHC